MARYRVHYQIATYRGIVDIVADDDADRELVIALAKDRLQRTGGPLPVGMQAFRVEVDHG